MNNFKRLRHCFREAVDEIAGEDLCDWLLDELPDMERQSLIAAFTGDLAEAEGLSLLLPNCYRGIAVVAAYYLGVLNPAYAEILRGVWSHDHDNLIAVVDGNLGLLRAMFQVGRFTCPFQGSIRLYRGVAGVSLETGAGGLSWSVSRDVAAYFAYRLANNASKSAVLTTEVDATDVIFWDDSRGEQEVILSVPPHAQIDPHPETWRSASQRYHSQRVAERADLSPAQRAGLISLVLTPEAENRFA